MKKLTDIRLINWHGFYDESIPVDGSVLVAGDNGSGKSSLIDAIYYLLSGGDQSKFNAAANEKTDRTVETYMRGRTGESSHPYLRSDPNIISHICLQFLDEKTLESFLIGVVLEIQEGVRDILKTFYYVPNHVLDDSLFKDEDGNILNYRLMEQKAPEGTFHLLGDSQKKVRATLYNDILQIDGKKYLDLLPKAVSFKPIDDVHEFVYRFLMPEKDVNIINMRTVVHSLNELTRTVKNEEAKKEALRSIAEKADLYNKSKKEASLYQALALNLASSSIEEEKEKLGAEIESLKRREKDLEEEQKKAEADKERVSRDIYALENDSSYLELRTIDEQIAEGEKKLSDAESRVHSYEARLAKEASLEHSLSVGNSLLDYLEHRDYEGLRKYLPLYQGALKKKKDELSASYNEVRNRLRSDKKEALALQKEKEELEAGRTVYPEAMTKLRAYIVKKVKDETGDEIDARPFAELIDIKEGEENWRYAIESLLAERRFDLFVDESHLRRLLGPSTKLGTRSSSPGSASSTSRGSRKTPSIRTIASPPSSRPSLTTPNATSISSSGRSRRWTIRSSSSERTRERRSTVSTTASARSGRRMAKRKRPTSARAPAAFASRKSKAPWLGFRATSRWKRRKPVPPTASSSKATTATFPPSSRKTTTGPFTRRPAGPSRP